MQNDQGYGQQDFLGGGPQHLDMTGFTASQHDVFGYPMSAPASASASFWDPNMSLSAMDMDFASQAAASGVLFQTPAPSQQQHDSYDWTSNNALYQNNSAAAATTTERPQSPNQENIRPAPKKERRLAPKPSTSSSQNVPVTSTSSTMPETYTIAPEAPFALSPGGGVNPGLLFSRPSSSSMGTDAFGLVSQPETSPRLLADAAPVAPSTVGPSGVQRSFSYRERGSREGRETVSSPIKPSASRPGVQRSFSDSRGKRKQPPLAPMSRPQTTPATQASRSGVGSNRPPPSRQNGRLSPSKLHHRLSSLSAIPETSGPRTRTSVKFTIDSHGRAHAETTVVVDEPGPSGIYRRTSRDSSRHGYMAVSESEESETDDEPILIPSRNASFALPDPHKPVGSIFGNSRKKKSKGPGSLTFDSRPGSRDDDDQSEAETVLEEGTGQTGDAASELRKVVEDRHNKRAAASQRSQHRQFSSGAFTWAGGNLLSPTADASIPTPSTGSRSHAQRIRCICHSNDHSSAADAFMVQCHSCELWLHGRCINITRRDMPPVYICAFCANTPNMRGGRVRDSGRNGAPSSPLAHKSLKTFR